MNGHIRTYTYFNLYIAMGQIAKGDHQAHVGSWCFNQFQTITCAVKTHRKTRKDGVQKTPPNFYDLMPYWKKRRNGFSPTVKQKATDFHARSPPQTHTLSHKTPPPFHSPSYKDLLSFVPPHSARLAYQEMIAPSSVLSPAAVMKSGPRYKPNLLQTQRGSPQSCPLFLFPFGLFRPSLELACRYGDEGLAGGDTAL